MARRKTHPQVEFMVEGSRYVHGHFEPDHNKTWYYKSRNERPLQ